LMGNKKSVDLHFIKDLIVEEISLEDLFNY